MSDIAMKSGTKFALTTVRTLLGLLFLFSGVNGLFGFLPEPKMGVAASLVWHGLAQTGYFFPLLRSVELVAAVLLLTGRAVPLALLLTAPIVVNVAAFHLAVAPEALGVVVLLAGLWGALAWWHRAALRPLAAWRAGPASAGRRGVELAFGAVFLASAIAAMLGKTPPPSTPAAATMWRGLAASGYFIPLLIAVQATAGILLVVGRLVPLALALLAPVVVEIVAYRLFAAGGGMLAVGFALLAAEIWLAWRHRAAFATALPKVAGTAFDLPGSASPSAT
jgi:hypothetical protein